MKLFQNLSNSLAEKVVQSCFLFIALAAISFTERNGLSNFGRQSPREYSCLIISKSMNWLSRGEVV